MILEDVRLQAFERNDRQSLYDYRSRMINVVTDKGNFSTPARVTTRSEYMARSGIVLERTVPLELAVDFRELDETHMLGFMTNSKIAAKVLGVTKQFNDLATRAVFRISVFQPPYTMLSRMSNEEKIRFADMQAEYLQKRLGSELISYPYMHMPVSEYKEFIDKHYLRTQDISTIFTLDMGMQPNDLEQILNHLIGKGQPTIIIMIYKDWQKAIPQHDLISNYFDKDKIVFFACQVERENQETHTSNLHSVSFGGGFDLVSLRQVRGYSDQTRLDLNKIRFFDPQTLGIDNLENTLSNHNRDIVKEFDLPSDNFNDFVYLNKIIKGYRGARVHPKKYQILYYLARMHEAIASPKVFERARTLIEKKEVIEHIIQTNLKVVPMIRRRKR